VMTISRSGVVTLVAGLGLLIPASAGLGLLGLQTGMCPFPVLTTMPLFTLSAWRLDKLAIVVPVLFFFAWHRGLFGGDAKVPRRSFVLLAAATALTGIYFVVSWKWGLEYQGLEYTRVVCLANVAWIALLFLGFGLPWQRKPSFKFSLFLHWMLLHGSRGMPFHTWGNCRNNTRQRGTNRLIAT